MDEKSKDIIDDILSHRKSGKFAGTPRTRPTMFEDLYKERVEREERDTRDRRERETLMREELERAKAKVEPKPAFSENPTSVNLKDEIAILSINQAKACIVLRATITDEISGLIASVSTHSQRKWNDRDGVWELHPAVLPALRPILKAKYKDVQVLGVQKQIQATKFDQLMSKLDSDDKTKIYKLLAMKHHPDKGGDKDTMTLINLVFKGGT